MLQHIRRDLALGCRSGVDARQQIVGIPQAERDNAVKVGGRERSNAEAMGQTAESLQKKLNESAATIHRYEMRDAFMLDVLHNVEHVLAIELIAAAQALDYRKPLRPGRGVERAHEVVRAHDRRTDILPAIHRAGIAEASHPQPHAVGLRIAAVAGNLRIKASLACSIVSYPESAPRHRAGRSSKYEISRGLGMAAIRRTARFAAITTQMI